MPRLSTKRKLLLELEKDLLKRRTDATLRLLLLESSSDESSGHEKGSIYETRSTDDSTGTIEEIITIGIEDAIERISSQRYAFPRKPYRKGYSKAVFDRDLQEDDDEDGTPPWLTDEEFLQKYRMNRESFKTLLDLIKDHNVFKHVEGRKGRRQAPAAYQLLVFLFYLGKTGSGANNPTLRQVFGIGRGTANVWKKRVCKAIRSLRSRYIYWPDVNERIQIAKRFYANYDFINCIAVADGTLFPLASEPESDDAPDYHGRKYQYSMSVMIVNDDMKKIRYYLSGFPGSAHDNRVYRNTELATDPETFFGNCFFLLADSALTNSPSVVSSFKCPRGHSLTYEQEKFNTLLGKCRVISEHTIGILKGRFPFLRGIPMKITNEKSSVRRILQMIECCIILHNLLIDTDDDIPDVWLDEFEDDVSEVGAAIGEYDYSLPILDQDSCDERRQRCIDYFKDMNMI
jgi:hypothetical protein